MGKRGRKRVKRVPVDNRHKAIRYFARLTPRAVDAFVVLAFLFVVRVAMGREIAAGSAANIALRAVAALVALVVLSYLAAACLDWDARRRDRKSSRR